VRRPHSLNLAGGLGIKRAISIGNDKIAEARARKRGFALGTAPSPISPRPASLQPARTKVGSLSSAAEARRSEKRNLFGRAQVVFIDPPHGIPVGDCPSYKGEVHDGEFVKGAGELGQQDIETILKSCALLTRFGLIPEVGLATALSKFPSLPLVRPADVPLERVPGHALRASGLIDLVIRRARQNKLMKLAVDQQDFGDGRAIGKSAAAFAAATGLTDIRWPQGFNARNRVRKFMSPNGLPACVRGAFFAERDAHIADQRQMLARLQAIAAQAQNVTAIAL
jgi:hypothetical protein